MRPLRSTLEAERFVPIYWPYESTQMTVEEHGVDLYDELQRLNDHEDIEEICLVTHSMGGIVARAALAHGVPPKVTRVVMLAPPNRGSARARLWAPLVGDWVQPLDDLRDDQREGPTALPTPKGIEIGIIAGSKDRIVRIPNTHLSGETDHITVKSGHTFIMNHAEVKRQVAAFLRQGHFQRD